MPPLTDDTSAFNATLATGSLAIPEGYYGLSGSIVVNNTAMPGETESGPGGRVVSGQDARLTVIQSLAGMSSAMIDVDYGVGAQAHAYHRFEKLALVGNPSIDGVNVRNAAFLRLSDLVLRGCDNGLRTISMLSSTVRDCRFDANSIGVNCSKGDGFSFTNAVKFDGCVFSNNSAIGLAIGDGAHNVQVIGGSVESNGTHGNAATGGIFLGFNGGAEGSVGALIEGVYFEGNGGGADLRLENAGADYVTVVVMACNFNRISSTKHVTNNIQAIGNINLILIGNAFKAYGTYTESAARKYINAGPGVRITDLGNVYQSPVAAPASAPSVSGGLRGSVASSGAAISLPAGWSVANIGAGVYRVTHGMGSTDYSVVATGADVNPFLVQRVVKTANFFDVATSNTAGALANSAFDFVVVTNA